MSPADDAQVVGQVDSDGLVEGGAQCASVGASDGHGTGYLPVARRGVEEATRYEVVVLFCGQCRRGSNVEVLGERSERAPTAGVAKDVRGTSRDFEGELEIGARRVQAQLRVRFELFVCGSGVMLLL